jgi:hypothetical protein
MLYLVEGMDNTGKTTLCARLHEDLHFPLVKCPSVRGMGLDESVEWQKNFLKLAYQHDIIADRLALISEAVYGPVLKKDNILVNNKFWPLLVHQFLAAKPMIIFCNPPLEVVTAWDGRQQMKGVQEHADALYLQYASVMDAWKHFVPVVMYDYTQPGAYQQLVDAIQAHPMQKPREFPEHMAMAAMIRPELFARGLC